MQWNANMRANNRIMEELGISILASTLSSLPTKKNNFKEGRFRHIGEELWQ